MNSSVKSKSVRINKTGNRIQEICTQLNDLAYVMKKGVQNGTIDYTPLFLIQKLYSQVLLNNKIYPKAWKALKEMVGILTDHFRKPEPVDFDSDHNLEANLQYKKKLYSYGCLSK